MVVSIPVDRIERQQAGKILGGKVRSLRDDRGWTQRVLSKKSGVPHTTIANIEKGQIPGADILYALSDVFEVSADYFRPYPQKNLSPAPD